jgi:hypothetical protein
MTNFNKIIQFQILRKYDWQFLFQHTVRKTRTNKFSKCSTGLLGQQREQRENNKMRRIKQEMEKMVMRDIWEYGRNNNRNICISKICTNVETHSKSYERKKKNDSLRSNGENGVYTELCTVEA